MKIHSGLTQNPANELLELLELLDKSPESQTTSRSQACQDEQAGTLHLDLVECSSSYLGSTFPAPAHLTRKASENIAVSETDESGHRQGSLKLFRCCTSTLGPTLGSSLAFLERRGRRGEAASGRREAASSRGGPPTWWRTVRTRSTKHESIAAHATPLQSANGSTT